MQIEDYETPDPYTPDPRASQRVAAQKRAQTQDDDAPVPTRRAPQQQLIVGIVGVLAVVGVIALAISQHGGLQRATPLAVTPGPSTQAFLATPAQAFGSDPKISLKFNIFHCGRISVNDLFTIVYHYR